MLLYKKLLLMTFGTTFVVGKQTSNKKLDFEPVDSVLLGNTPLCSVILASDPILLETRKSYFYVM